jgi:DNA-3-methyladenine glycosylase
VAAGPGRLTREFFARDAIVVAPELLNLVLVGRGAAGRIVEAEAYGGELDAASHAYRGPSRRNATMFGPPGHLYVYFTYGMHHCANVVCGPEGVARAVLIRALAPLRGLGAMRRRRGGHLADVELCSGPAKLCQALGIDRADDGTDLVSRGGLVLVDDGTPPPADPRRGRRVGLSARSGEAAAYPWRFAVPGEPNVSGVGWALE